VSRHGKGRQSLIIGTGVSAGVDASEGTFPKREAGSSLIADQADLPSSCCAVILAAGSSKRMGIPKALATWPSRALAADRLGWRRDPKATPEHTSQAPSFLEGILRTCHEARIPAVVVTRPDQTDLHRAIDLLENLGLPLHRATNPMARSEMVDSFWFGAQEALRLFPASVSLLVWPVDCPAVSVADLAHLANRAEAMPDSYLVLSWRNEPGHPASIPRSVVEAMPSVGVGTSDRTGPTTDLRRLTRSICGPAVLVEATDRGILMNLNRPQDLNGLAVQAVNMKP